MDEQAKPVWAGFWSRLGAFIVDGVVLGVVGYLIGFTLFDRLAALGSFGRLIGLVLAVTYFGVLGSGLGNGQTLGKRLFKLQVLGLDGRPLSLARACGRALVLVLPSILNGLFIAADPSVLTAVLGVLDITIIFGVGLTQIYLYLFNRPGRRVLHDLIFGSAVVRAGMRPVAAPLTSARRIIATSILGLVFALSTGLSVWALAAQPKLFPALTKPMQAVQRLADVMSAGVLDNTSQFYSGGQTTVTRTLVINARMRTWPADQHRAAARIARVVLANYRFAPGQRLQINLQYGFELGIASGWRSYAFTDTPQTWSAAP